MPEETLEFTKEDMHQARVSSRRWAYIWGSVVTIGVGVAVQDLSPAPLLGDLNNDGLDDIVMVGEPLFRHAYIHKYT